MALIDQINFNFVDGKGARSTTTINVPTGLSDTDLQAAASTFAQLIANMTDCQLTSVALCKAIDISGLLNNAAPAGTVDVEEGARFVFSSLDGYRTSMRIPGFPEAKLLAGTQVVNPADGDVIAFVSLMEAGYVGVTDLIAPSTSHAEDIAQLDSARDDFQRTRKL